MKLAGLLISAVILAVCALGVRASAVSIGDGNLIASFDGVMSPKELPRTSPAPVSMRVAGNIRSASGDVEDLSQLRRIKVEINREGRLYDRGLPVCRVADIRSATLSTARRSCGSAIVGSGHVVVQARLVPQPSFAVRAKMLVFNGPRRNGKKLILGQVYARTPPGAFVLVFQVSRQAGTYGTVLSTTLPAGAVRWAYLTHFDMTLHRTYDYRGRSRSYVAAACSAPAGFDRAVFPLARATYGFATGQRLTISETGICRVAH